MIYLVVVIRWLFLYQIVGGIMLFSMWMGHEIFECIKEPLTEWIASKYECEDYIDE